MRMISLFLATAAIVAPAAAFAQETTSTIRGEVTSGGAAVPGAQVVITHVPSGTVSRSTTDGSGAFNASGLRIGGPFTVAVSAEGYEAVTITDISLTAGVPFRVPVELVAAGEEIVITGTRVGREQSQGPITTLTREDIEGVASITRDIRDIARRDPLVNLDLAPGSSRAIEIAGTNGRFNRFSVDGVQFSDDFGLNGGGLPTSRGPVPFDAIEQLSVKVAPYDVEEGDFQGGAINVVLRSGGNRLTGSGFYTYSDDSLTGDRTRGQDVDLEFKSEQYGGFLSGPIIKDRLFFALAYEKLIESDPLDNGPIGLGFANEIPRVGQAELDLVSNIAQSVFNFDTGGVLRNADEQDEKFTAKLDFNITDNQRASLTYIRNKGTQQFNQNTSTNNQDPQFGFRSNGYELTEEVNSGVFQLNSSWNDNFSTELRVAYRDYNRDQTPFGGREFAQFQVCLDPVAIGSATSCTTAAGAIQATPELFFGPDISRQSNDLNTDNLSVDFEAGYQSGRHTLKGTFGYSKTDTFNLFLQRSLGAFYFDSIADFRAGRAGSLGLASAVPSGDPNDAGATFSNKTYTFGVQDDIDVTDALQVTIGARYDLFGSDDRPALNQNFLSRYGFSNRETYSGRGVFQPRFGFNFEATDRLIIRGGAGIFAGGTPDVYLSNSFSNTGQLTNSITIQRNATCNADPLCNAALNGVNGRTFNPIVTAFLLTNTASLAAAPVNAIDPSFQIPAVFRSSLSFNYNANLGPLGDEWLFGADFIYGETHHGIRYTDIRSVPIGTAPDGRTRYGPFGGLATNNQDLLLSNDNRGRSKIAVARFQKDWDFGLGIGASYTYQDIEDVSAVTSSTASSNYGLTAFADPNNPALGTSIYQIRHAVKGSIDFNRAFFGDYKTRISLFGEYRTGRPFSYTFRDPSFGRSPVFGTLGSSNRYLLYVPQSGTDALVTYDSETTRTAFNAFIDANPDLAKFRGRIVPKNTGRSPSFFKVDLHVDQEIPVPLIRTGRIKVFADVENFLNLLDSDWGALRQVGFPYFASLVNVACAQTSGANCTQYRYSGFQAPNEALQARQSLYQVRLGVKFEF